jgi:hypothetical protein
VTDLVLSLFPDQTDELKSNVSGVEARVRAAEEARDDLQAELDN